MSAGEAKIQGCIITGMFYKNLCSVRNKNLNIDCKV